MEREAEREGGAEGGEEGDRHPGISRVINWSNEPHTRPAGAAAPRWSR